MGRIAIGCLVVLLAVAAAGGVAWFKFVKPGMDFAGDVVRFGEEFQQLDRSITNRARFTPPGDGILDERQFERFLAAQSGIRARMEAHLGPLNEKYSELKAKLDADDAEPGLRDLAGAYRDFGGLLLEAKRAQVEALNTQNFSQQEYLWVRQQVYLALGESVGAMAAVEGAGDQPRTRLVPEESVALVNPHRETLMETHVLAWWGL